MAESSIVVDHLVKHFEVTQKKPGFVGALSSIFSPVKKKVKAVDDISFKIRQGELVGFIGPNGAGKTTTLKLMSGLLYPSSGLVQVGGFDPWDRKPKFLKQISLVMGQKNQLWWDLPAQDTLELNKTIYEIPDKEYKDSLHELVSLLEVEDLMQTQVRRLSLGQRMRLELVAALIHKPQILFLDEPTLGLDVVAQQKIRDFIFEYNKKHLATIILTSHNMDDLINLTKRVIVINKGVIIFDGGLNELVTKFASKKIITVYFSKETDLKRLADVGTVEEVSYPRAVLSVPRETSALASAQLLRSFPVADLNIEEEPIEDVITRVFKGETEE